jgi:protein subunit release factor A
MHNLDAFMDGDIDEMIDTVATYYQAENLKKINQ